MGHIGSQLTGVAVQVYSRVSLACPSVSNEIQRTSQLSSAYDSVSLGHYECLVGA